MLARKAHEPMSKTQKTEAEWRLSLTPQQFDVTRKGATERAFTGPYWDTKDKGIYHCVCCGAPLFTSEAKFDSGTGWPSFFQPLSDQALAERADNGLFSKRTEVVCAHCEAHLGHVFPDGPQPTGLRYCINGVALQLDKEKD